MCIAQWHGEHTAHSFIQSTILIESQLHGRHFFSLEDMVIKKKGFSSMELTF